MKKLTHRERIFLVLAIILIILIVILSLYRMNKLALLDKADYKEMYKTLETDAEEFNSQKDMCKYIISWAKKNNLKYKLDDNYNIIFEQKAAKTKSKVSPTVVICNYNYENAVDNRRCLASAAMIAKTKLNSGKKTVIFVNNRNNDGDAYANIDSKYFPDNAKVIYLDYGKSAYVSASSFSSADQTVSVPTEKDEITCDTAIKIHIGGVESDCIDTSITKANNPISLFSTLLIRLKSKSTICQLAEIKVGNNGKMYPTSLDATIMINSYQVDSFTGYIDKRIKAFDKATKDNEDAYYEYEVIEDTSKYPESAYSKETFDSLTTILYALKNGVYRYDEDDVVLDGYEVGDIYGIECINQLRVEDDNIYVDVNLQANSKKNMDDMLSDNAAATKLAKCTIKTVDQIKKFDNSNTGLIPTLKTTYFKVNTLSGTTVSLAEENDTYFTPMSYLSMINNKMDIVHIKINSKSASVLTNMLLCYIQTKGNFLSL